MRYSKSFALSKQRYSSFLCCELFNVEVLLRILCKRISCETAAQSDHNEGSHLSRSAKPNRLIGIIGLQWSWSFGPCRRRCVLNYVPFWSLPTCTDVHNIGRSSSICRYLSQWQFRTLSRPKAWDQAYSTEYSPLALLCTLLKPVRVELM